MTTTFVPDEEVPDRPAPPAELVDPPPVETAEFENAPSAEDEPPHPAQTASEQESGENTDTKQNDNASDEKPRKRTLF
jgi:hypothetical protein